MAAHFAIRAVNRVVQRQGLRANRYLSYLKDEVHLHPMEPAKPYVHSNGVPGSKSLMEMQKYSDGIGGTGSATSFIVNVEESIGNYISDIDGNQLLDCFGQIGSLPLGYNHPELLAAASSSAHLSAQVHRLALGMMPPAGWTDLLEKSLGSIAPKGLDKVQTMACGSCANENAMKVAMIVQAQRRRVAAGLGADEFSAEDEASVMRNSAPGAPTAKVLSFEGAFHGRTFGALSCTRSKPIHKLDVAQLDWPSAPFPVMRYPLAAHEAENRAEIDRCLSTTRDIIRKESGQIAAMIIEPIQAEGGDRHAPVEFFRGLRELALEEDVTFIVDEVQTGFVSSGNMWAHEAWGLENPPDIVTFGKKTQIAGYFYPEKMQMTLPYRIFNTWMGDPAKLLQLKTIVDVVNRDNLILQTREVGEMTRSGLETIERLHPDLTRNARGQGTLCAIDIADPPTRDRVIVDLRNNGVLAGACGTETIRIRPTCIFDFKHAEIFLDTLDLVLRGV